MKRPLAVALTGGIAAGKSEALQAFGRHGAAVISSDDVVHRLYREDEGLQAALRERWGERVFRDDEVRPSLDPERWEADGMLGGSGLSLTEAVATPASGIRNLFMEAVAQPA